MIRKLVFFFPLQLLLVNLKRNHLLLLLWVVLFGFVGKHIANKYGIPYLFLAPEYLSEVSFWSYCIVGFAVGGFVMTFNISSYIINSKRFPFVATLKNPFVKFCINNSLLPLIFIVYYCIHIIFYHIENENNSAFEITLYILGLLSGYTLNVILSLTYFLSTNKNIFKILGVLPESKSKTPTQSLLSKESNIYSILKSKIKWHVETYLSSPFKLKVVKPFNHYDDEMLKSITSHNHINASIFEIIVFTSLIILGLFGENDILAIPAGASIILFFTIIFILISAFYTWLKGWTTITIFAVFLIINYLSKKDVFNFDNRAYGLNYQTEKAEYSVKKINALANHPQNLSNDIKNEITTLNTWKQNTQSNKPKIIFINTSGGGSRSSLWTFNLLQLTDSLSSGKLFSQTRLITGSSGGMIGAAYFRELYLRKDSLQPSLYSTSYRNNMAKDLLNPVAFSIATNDMFIRLKKHQDGKYTYTKDRGFAFEKQLLMNTNYILDKRLSDYVIPEKEAKIPLMIFSPTIINDGRRLLIASQPISYLSDNSTDCKCINKPIIDNVEFTQMFKEQDALNLKFTNALRMSATFPIIMPKVALPSNPEIAVMDAGMRDNFGSLTTYKYIYTFKKWINENTSGVVILNFRDKVKELPIKDNATKSITENLFSPVGSLYDNLFSTQDYNQDAMLLYLSSNLNQPVNVINFELNNTADEIALSWHLTTKDKEKVINSILTPNNQESLEQLNKLIRQ